jgi:hypothetical protein
MMTSPCARPPPPRLIASAVLDRLLHRSVTITIRGENYRLKGRRTAALLTATPRTAPAPHQVQS